MRATGQAEGPSAFRRFSGFAGGPYCAYCGNHIRERDRNETPPTVAVRESKVIGEYKDPRSNLGHAPVRSNGMEATTDPRWR